MAYSIKPNLIRFVYGPVIVWIETDEPILADFYKVEMLAHAAESLADALAQEPEPPADAGS